MAATEYFALLVEDESDCLSLEKFLEFWRKTKASGVLEDEIIVHLELTELKEMWIGLDIGQLAEAAKREMQDNAIETLKLPTL